MDDATICEKGGAGWVLPFSENEHELNPGLRAFLYALIMLYFFLGVSIVAESFMGAITTITARRIQVVDKDGRRKTEKVWNSTVATLTLMALGSSAPEIFLSVMDIFKKKFEFGKLGPATILGSASFNLFVIVPVCVVAVPSDEIRRIKDLPAFFITASFQFIAYGWLGIILVNSSVDQVDVWEAVFTFLLFPIFVWISYKVDRGAADPLLRRLNILERTARSIEGQPQLCFESEVHRVVRSDEPQVCDVRVNVPDDFVGKARCKYYTEALTAHKGYDYVDVDGELRFDAGTNVRTIEIQILPRTRDAIDVECMFLVVLEGLDGAAVFNPNTDGGAESAIMTVVVSDPELQQKQQQITAAAKVRVMVARTFSEWTEQFVEALYCGGSRDAQQEASKQDWVYHVVAFPWKVFCAFIPPCRACRGWLSFAMSLAEIGLLTAILGDTAEIFGCVLEVPDIVTAITFVALGTSMPDLFASLSAAKADPTADASIVNVTGSNSVNVFLGIGLPWTIASVFWRVIGATDKWKVRYPDIAARYPDGAFAVRASDLGFSVVVFSSTAVVALCVIRCRRLFWNGELGGPRVPKLTSAYLLIALWLYYISLCVWRSKATDVSFKACASVGSVGLAVVFVSTIIFCLGATVFTARGQDHDCSAKVAPDDTPPPPKEPSTREPPGAPPTFEVPPQRNGLGPDIDTNCADDVMDADIGSDKMSDNVPCVVTSFLSE